MPIINAASSVWLTGEVWLPGIGSTYAAFSSFDSQQISNRNEVTDVTYGYPYAKVWDVGHTYWQTKFTCPILLLQDTTAATSPYYEATQFIYAFLAEMLRTSGFKSGDSFTSNTLKTKWDFDRLETISSNNVDFIIDNLSIDITEDDASFTVSIISTTDLRKYFKISNRTLINKPLIDNTVYRLAKPFDITIPNDCIGAPFGFMQSSEKQWPQQTTNSNYYSSLLREFHLTLESQTTQVASIGIPSSRPFLGVTSIKSSGNISFIPLFYDPLSTNIAFQETAATFAPAGWTVDMQSIDNLQGSLRHGGKLYVSMDMTNPMYVQALIKTKNYYIVNGKDANTPLGPVSTSSWGLNTNAGQTNEISVDFITSPGITEF